MLYLNNEEIVKQHLRDLQSSVEQHRVAQQVLAIQREISKLNRQSKNSVKAKQSIFNQFINLGKRML
ncbi:hypothetical protein ACP8HI_01205 [Paenibacillus sp. FA6]|uniref:hypothetical protein n=1 Tax=Paenibacillus sp. FA6 TaxID=3413029 RepID=UPI003F655E7C